MASDHDQSASVGDNGASVNIHFGNGFKQFQLIVIALFLSIALNLALALYATTAAVSASKEARLDSYWLERAEVACASKGVVLPPPPTIPKQ